MQGPGSSTKCSLGSIPDQFYVDPDVARDALRRRSMFNVIEMTSGWKLDPRRRW